MTIVMSAEEYAQRSGANLADLERAIEEARADAIKKESMDRDSLTARNITLDTERYMRELIARP